MLCVYLSVKQNNGLKQSCHSWGCTSRGSSARVVDATVRGAKTITGGLLAVGSLQQLPRQAVRHLQI